MSYRQTGLHYFNIGGNKNNHSSIILLVLFFKSDLIDIDYWFLVLRNIMKLSFFPLQRFFLVIGILSYNPSPPYGLGISWLGISSYFGLSRFLMISLAPALWNRTICFRRHWLLKLLGFFFSHADTPYFGYNVYFII